MPPARTRERNRADYHGAEFERHYVPTPSKPAALAPVARANTSMGPVPVVVIDGHVKDPLQVWLVQNQQPVETF